MKLIKTLGAELGFMLITILTAFTANLSPVENIPDKLNSPSVYPDSYPPWVLSIKRTGPDPYPPPVNTTSVDFDVTFSEDVTDVDIHDFWLTTTGVTNPSITLVVGQGNSYLVTVNTGTGNGTIRLDVPISASVADLAGNSLAGLPFTSGEEYSIVKNTTFTDVAFDHIFWKYIEAFYRAGLTTGCSASPKKYCPDALVTRAEMATFIERALGNFKPNPNPIGMFSDVPYPGLTHLTPFIEEFYNDSLTTGCSVNPLKYCPQNNVTRAEMATFIERALGNFKPNPNPRGMFADVPYPGLEHLTPFIEQFYNDGITMGCLNDPLRYCPANKVTRAEMAVFIVRAFGIPLP